MSGTARSLRLAHLPHCVGVEFNDFERRLGEASALCALERGWLVNVRTRGWGDL